MKKNEEYGFTLMEVIVGINLGFLVLSVVVSFFLFSTKFISATTSNLEKKQNVNEFLIRLNNSFRTSNNFVFEQKDSNYIFTLNSVDTISINKHSFSLKKQYKITNIKNYELSITSYDNEKILIKDGMLLKGFYNSGQNLFTYSGDIKVIEMMFTKNKSSYNFSYYSPDISINKFRNITN